MPANNVSLTACFIFALPCGFDFPGRPDLLPDMAGRAVCLA
jgi:hypothetical protein